MLAVVDVTLFALTAFVAVVQTLAVDVTSAAEHPSLTALLCEPVAVEHIAVVLSMSLSVLYTREHNYDKIKCRKQTRKNNRWQHAHLLLLLLLLLLLRYTNTHNHVWGSALLLRLLLLLLLLNWLRS
jgi:hypothetical protein